MTETSPAAVTLVKLVAPSSGSKAHWRHSAEVVEGLKCTTVVQNYHPCDDFMDKNLKMKRLNIVFFLHWFKNFHCITFPILRR